MSTLREAAQQALEALDAALGEDQPYFVKCGLAIVSLRAALEQEEQEQEQEPVAWAREWKGLTDEEIQSLTHHLDVEREYEAYTGDEYLVVNGASDFARAIEAALKERNHG